MITRHSFLDQCWTFQRQIKEAEQTEQSLLMAQRNGGMVSGFLRTVQNDLAMLRLELNRHYMLLPNEWEPPT